MSEPEEETKETEKDYRHQVVCPVCEQSLFFVYLISKKNPVSKKRDVAVMLVCRICGAPVPNLLTTPLTEIKRKTEVD